MSQLRRAPSSSRPEGYSKLSWAEFVQHVLGLTVKAYQAMRRDRVAERGWEENVFTKRLGDYIITIVFDDESPVRVSVGPKVYTEQMRKGEQPTTEAKEIDLQMFDVWERDYLNKHFV